MESFTKVWSMGQFVSTNRSSALESLFPSRKVRIKSLSWQVAGQISRRLTQISLRDERGRRPVFGGRERFQQDPLWRDLIPLHEYFHGDNGAGIGASHQTGWTALVAKLIQQYAS
jgi:hypothetical protein